MTEQSQTRPRTSLAEKVYDTMHTRIMRGDFSPNEKLPAETDLSVQFGVSRPILRAALERLREEGLIYSRQGAGNFVRLKQANPLGYAKVETIADIQRCYEFRLTVESAAAGMAAKRRNLVVLGDMQRALDMLADATGSRMHREDADFAFHVAVASGSNNSYFVETLRALREHIHVGMKLHGESLMSDGAAALEEVLAEHRAIFDAIKEQDADRAQTVMHAHIEHSRNRLFGASLLDLSLQDKS
ncbi:FadR/GntR family transcriptional regulator [Roseicitreum antarcticum]|uniref:GntR family transcriptional regulator, transcriptional repressor for pyruvate dehydrogenase complex n=1 Tax=Roseicitreum antarcticum TaxID=564137 RepID=A0A1H2Z1D0_9RHOB|nr:FadR/GntR family transcriptional regulator [Roseicitreum antarcticum]SDX11127.1 GntR family transcriptional regulator, transcriptional repressor for pyruvate dehydrogenase complex [Roseicitreum antarcticum]